MEIGRKTEEEIDLRDIWRIIVQRRLIIVFVFSVVFIGGLIWLLLQTNLYEGEATLLVEDNKSVSIDVLSSLSSGGPNAIETEMEILKSRSIAEQVVRELSLDAILEGAPANVRIQLRELKAGQNLTFVIQLEKDRSYIAYDAAGNRLGRGKLGESFIGEGVSWYLDMSEADAGVYRFTTIPFAQAVSALRSRVEISEAARNTNVIRVTAQDANPYIARDIANKVVEAYLAQNIDRKGQEATQTLEFIEKQLETIRLNLEKGEAELDQFKSDKGIFILSSTAQKLIEQISRFEIAKAELELQGQQINLLTKNLSSAGEKDSPYILGEVSLPDQLVTKLIGELSGYLVELRAKREDLTEDNPQLALLRAKIDETKQKIRLAVANAKSSIESRRTTLEEIITGYEGQLKGLPKAERELAGIARKSQVNAELYTFLLKKHEEARIARAGIVGNVRILDPSLVPAAPVFPKVNRILFVLVVAGFFSGLAVAFSIEYLDDTVKSIDEVVQNFGLNVYGLIPFVELAKNSELTLTELDPRDPIQEAFRSLRTNISFSNTDKQIRTILCTSALPGAGKTTLTVNLGISLAQGGNKVLLVDCDLRRPQVHDKLGLSLSPGLTNALSGSGGWRDLVSIHSGTPNLSVLTAGIIPPNPAELLASSKFKELLQETKQGYDYVLFDIPPVVVFTDAAILASLVDAVFLVIDIGHTGRTLVRRAIDLLQNVNANVKGALLNKVQMSGQAAGYYFYSYYYQNPELAQTGLNRVKRLFLRLIGRRTS